VERNCTLVVEPAAELKSERITSHNRRLYLPWLHHSGEVIARVLLWLCDARNNIENWGYDENAAQKSGKCEKIGISCTTTHSHTHYCQRISFGLDGENFRHSLTALGYQDWACG
jgi:hypothetical protein